VSLAEIFLVGLEKNGQWLFMPESTRWDQVPQSRRWAIPLFSPPSATGALRLRLDVQ